MRRTLSLIFMGLFSGMVVTETTYGSAPEFTNLSDSDVEAILTDVGATWTHTSVSPASTLGELFGFEVGLVAGGAKVPNIEKFSREVDPNSEVSVLPQAGLLGAVSIPAGIKFELLLFPENEIDDLTFKYGSIGVQWTLTQSLLQLPADLAVKVHSATATLNYNQEINSVNTAVEIEDKVSGLSLIASKKLVLFEPYIGLGVVKMDGSFSLSGTETFLDSNLQSASRSIAAPWGWIALRMSSSRVFEPA